MGGNALKKVIVSRVNLSQYNEIKNDLKNKLSIYIHIEFPIEIPGKMDFGDIDVLVQTKPDNTNIVNLVKQVYKPKEIVSNGPVCSFAYYMDSSNIYFQVDLICVKDLMDNVDNYVPMSKFYFSYGDLGGIIGRLTQFKNITFGSNGLWINPNYETISNYVELSNILDNLNKSEFIIDKETISKQIISKIVLTSNPQEICKYLELDWNKWVEGFNSKEEIFEWICNSSWFHKEMFDILELNYAHRRRENIRPMYSEFIKYISSDNLDNLDKSITVQKPNHNYSKYNQQIEALVYFGKIEILSNEIINVGNKMIRKNKFSGKKFVDLGIKTNLISSHIEKFRLYIQEKTNMDLDMWLDMDVVNSIVIDENIREFLEIINNNK